MGNFPYNTHKYRRNPESANGCPLTYNEAFAIAAQVRLWHGCLTNTDNWTQSGDGGYEDEVHLTYGLMELLSDPGAVRRLISVGEVTIQTVKRLLESDIEGEFWEKSRRVVGELFED